MESEAALLEVSEPRILDISHNVAQPSRTEGVKQLEAESLTLKKKIQSRKFNFNQRLPSMTAVRTARQTISYEVERKIAEELTQKESAIIPDGTGRNVIGKVGGTMIQIGGKIRA